ncbi:myelin protein P0 isoform X1 [Gasterosteus aculeatus]
MGRAGPLRGVWLGINRRTVGFLLLSPVRSPLSRRPPLLRSPLAFLSPPSTRSSAGLFPDRLRPLGAPQKPDTMLTFLALASVVLLGIVPEQTQAIVIYTGWERHALLGSDVRLSCSFFSWRWTSEDVTFSWTYRPDGSRDSISIFHYTGGMAYVDNKGPFRDRVEFVGNPGRRDGSILIKNLDYADNGTFTCDAKNPPDIVGRPSSVRLLVFEKVPIQAGVITGAIIGVVLGLLVLIVVIYYLMRFLVARRVFSLSVSKHGKKKKEGSQQRQGPAPPADPSKVKAASSEKKKQESRKDKK